MDSPVDDARKGRASVRYLLAAGTAAMAYLAVLKGFLAAGLPYMLAILCAQVVIIPCAFVAYRSLVFGPGSTVLADFLRFLAVWVGGAVAGLASTPVLVELAGTDPWFAQVLAIIAVAAVSFVSHLRFSFRRRPR